MWRYFRALWYACTGRFSAAANSLRSNKYVMAQTYDNAIAKGAERFNTVRDAVAQLITLEQILIQDIKGLNADLEKTLKVQVGAKGAMQKRIDALRAAGKAKEEIQNDPDFIKHSGYYKDATSSKELLENSIKDKEDALHEKAKQSARYKFELQQMQKQQQSLRNEKNEAIADVAIAQQSQAINDVLAGISEDTTDKELQEARQARKEAQAKAKVTAELAGNDASLVESEYLELASNSAADKELDGLLNWGDEDTAVAMKDAKLPE